ncbi:MAG: acyloxyacyl hydrolase [Fluviicola sp.]|nr:acyloxyacyl hydrolase [Fluviicola sp.]
MLKLLIVILFIASSCFSQTKNDVWIDGRAKLGFLAAHSSVMGHLARQHAKSAELGVTFQTKGKKQWHKAYNYPTMSLTAFYSTVGNREILGSYVGIFGSMNLPLVKRKHYCFSAKIAAGMAYTNKVYNSETNILNVAVSTNFNSRITMGIDNQFTFGNHSYTFGIDASHFSNAAIKTPNLGINMLFISLGYRYRIKQNIDTIQVEIRKEKYWEYGVLGILSVKETFPTGAQKYPVYGVNLFGRRFFGQKTGMEVSLDFISKQIIKIYQDDVPKTQAEILQIGAFVGFILPFDRFHLITGMGVYIKDKYQPEDAFYHRVGMRYVMDNGIQLNLVLKSHWARADYTEFGIGYTFKR